MLLELLRIRRTYRNLNRARQIINVFIKHGLGQFVEQLNLHRLLPFRKRIKILTSPPVAGKNIAERLRKAFEELGPSFIKLAQILSSRPDLITSTFADEFKKLQDEVPPFPFGQVKEILEKEFNRSTDEIFASFGHSPIAAASIAQVHEATLPDGTSVMVKIQRPRIKEIIETDIDIMGFIAGLMVKYWPETAFFNPLGIVEEFSRTIRKELDFLEEAKNIARFRRNFQNYPDVFIPGTYPGLVTGKIIVMDKVEGVRIDDIEGISRLGYDMPEIAKKGVKIYFKMLFEDGFFHGDPHPGNLFIMPDGTIGIVDFGIVGWLPPEIVENFAGALIALVHKDFDSLIDQYIELGLLNEEVDIETFKREFKSDLMNFFVPLYDMTISEIDVAQYLDTLTHLAIKHRIRIPSDLLLVNKTMLILDSIGRLLDPNFNLMASAEPYAAKLVQRRYSPERILARGKKYATDLSDFLITTPKQARLILRRLLRDELQLNMNITTTEKMAKDFHQAANRLSFSIIVAAILLSSSMILSSQVGIQVGIIKIAGIPLIPMLGGLTALVLGFWLLVSILRSGKL